MSIEPGWNWGSAWNGVRRDLNVLAWLFEEERTTQRLYVESMFWALTGKKFTVDEFARQVGLGVAAEGSADVAEQSAAGALDGGCFGETGLGVPGDCSCKESEAPQV